MKKTFDSANTFYLVDGSSFLYRSFFSLPPMHTKTGQPVQVVYGYCRMIKKLINQFKPECFGVVWDAPKSEGVIGERHAMYEHYKEQRQSSPMELNAQRDVVKEFNAIIGLKQIEIPGVEADDILYSLAKDAEKAGKDVVLITSDKDMRQCVSEAIFVYDPFQDAMLDREAIEAKYGIPLEKLIFYFALIGDTSDNIPGVRGIGPKTAQELVKNFLSVADLYNRIAEVPKERTRKLLEESRENAFLSEKLFTLMYHECGVEVEDFAFTQDQWFRAREFFKRLDFTSMLKDFPQETAQQGQISMFETIPQTVPAAPEEKPIPAEFVAITTREQLKQCCAEIQKTGVVAIDTETNSLDALHAQLVGISLCCAQGKAYYIPLAHKTVIVQLTVDTVVQELKPIFEDINIKKYLHHAKFDRLSLSTVGLELVGIVFDTLIAASLVTREGQRINLKWLSSFYLNQKMVTFEEVVTKQRLKDFSYVPLELATQYAAADAHQTFSLVPILEAQLEKNEQKNSFYQLEMPLSELLYQMERAGILIDPTVLDDLDTKIQQAINAVEQKIHALLPEGYNAQGLNLNSPKQLEDLLFNVLKLPPIKKTAQKTGYSTDQEVLQELAKLHPIAGLIVTYRELYKIKSTYLEALREAMDPKTKKIHTSFSQTITATGRLSSFDPNLQNIPVSDEWPVRSAFKAAENYALISADYSQIELRVLAHISQDSALIEAFKAGHDIHAETASGLFNVPLESVDSKQRGLAKTINFSILYGMSAYSLARDLDISQKEAQQYIERYFAHYPKVVEWMETVVDFAKDNGYVQTLWGRRRYVPGIYEKNRNLYELARRVAINTVVQGTAAELMKKGMLALHEQLQQQYPSSTLLLQIHDELIIQSPLADVESVQNLTKTTLETIVSWNIPLVVTLRHGLNWQSITK